MECISCLLLHGLHKELTRMGVPNTMYNVLVIYRLYLLYRLKIKEEFQDNKLQERLIG